MDTCQWFALCDRPADGVVRHTVLGDVPTCRRCADKLDLTLEDRMTDIDIPKPGDRIELVRTSDEYTLLKPGDTGTVERVTRHPSGWHAISISWDTGSGLMLLAGVDEWRVLPKLKAVR